MASYYELEILVGWSASKHNGLNAFSSSNIVCIFWGCLVGGNDCASRSSVLLRYMVYFIFSWNINVYIYTIQCRSMLQGICVLFARKRCMLQSCYGVNIYSVKTVSQNGMCGCPLFSFLTFSYMDNSDFLVIALSVGISDWQKMVDGCPGLPLSCSFNMLFISGIKVSIRRLYRVCLFFCVCWTNCRQN